MGICARINEHMVKPAKAEIDKKRVFFQDEKFHAGPNRWRDTMHRNKITVIVSIGSNRWDSM